MSFVCGFCKCTFEWGMYYNNHMRNRHNSRVESFKKIKLTNNQKQFLLNYYEKVSDHPSLGQIKSLAESINIKKETVYWWFHNQRYKIMKQQLKMK